MYNSQSSTYNDNSKAKQHTPYNRSVYSGMNKCNCIPNTAYEVEYINELLPNGGRFCIYKSDSNQYMRAVYFPNNKVLTGCAGILFNSKSGEILWGEVSPSYRRAGIYKQLKTMVYLQTSIKLWSQFQTNALLNAAKMAGH